MRGRQPRVVSLILAALVTSWGLASVPAFAAPITTPVIAAPLDGSTVGGDVTVSATSVAATVQLYVDGIALGVPVAVATGTASVQWLTWGLANSSSHVLTAADCDVSGCGTQSAGVTVTIDNSAPGVTAPAGTSTTGPNQTLSAVAPGGGLAFFVDSVQAGFDATSPYALAVGPLTEGAHTTFVRECDASGTTCDGPTSPVVSFTVKILHPRITSVSPNPFSPNRDGRSDITSFRINLPDTETVTWLIRNSNEQLLAGPHVLGALGRGNHNYRWGGRTNAGRIAGDGKYTIVVTSFHDSGGVRLRGTATATVRVDKTPPTLAGITGSGATFYPVVDGYHDQFGPRATVNEGGRLWLQVFNRLGATVASIGGSHSTKGTFQRVWNGRNLGGALVAEGRYRYRFLAEDPAGNRRASANYYVYASHKRLVGKTATLSRNGRDGTIVSSDWSCTQYNYNSNFANGVWLDNVCYQPLDDFQAIAALYSFSIPGAVQYNNIRVRSYGTPILNAPEPIAAIIYNFSTAQWDPVGAVYLASNQTPAWSTFGTVSAHGRVSGGRSVRVGIGVPDTYYLEDYDIGAVRIIVSYTVLQ